MVLKAAEILAGTDSEFEDVPAWGGVVRISVMSGADRARYEDMLATGKEVDVRAALVFFSAVDETGTRLFVDADIAALSAKSAKVLDRLARVALRVNALRAVDVKEAEKN